MLPGVFESFTHLVHPLLIVIITFWWKTFYQKVISYAERVLLSKFDENWMKIKDFLKNTHIWPLGGAHRGVGQIFYQKVISYIKRVLLSKFGENWRRNEDFKKNNKIWPLGGTR